MWTSKKWKGQVDDSLLKAGLALKGMRERMAVLGDRLNEVGYPMLDGGITKEEHADLLARTEELEAFRKDIIVAVDEGITRVDRAEKRVNAVVRRGRKVLAEHGLQDEGIEAEFEQLRVVDGERSDGSEVPAVQEILEADELSASGMPLAAMMRLRGLG